MRHLLHDSDGLTEPDRPATFRFRSSSGGVAILFTYRRRAAAHIVLLAVLLVAAPVGAQHGDDPQTGHAESTGAADEEAAHESGGGLMDVKPGLMIWTLATFLVLLTVLRFTAWKPLIGALEAREQRIREAVEQAEKTRLESEALVARHEEQLEAARVEARQIIEEGKADALRVKNDIVAQARHEAEETKARALREVELATDSAKKELWEEATRLSTLLAERILRRSLSEGDDRRLVEQVFDEFRSVRPSSGD